MLWAVCNCCTGLSPPSPCSILSSKQWVRSLLFRSARYLVKNKTLSVALSPVGFGCHMPPSAVRSQDFVCSLLKTLSLLDCTTHLESLLSHFLSLPKCYPLETVLIPAAEEFDQWSGKKSDALIRFSVSALLNWKPQRRHPLMSRLIGPRTSPLLASAKTALS